MLGGWMYWVYAAVGLIDVIANIQTHTHPAQTAYHYRNHDQPNGPVFTMCEHFLHSVVSSIFQYYIEIKYL